ncbi:MAG: glycosyltransferase family 4 protein [Phycisphaerae bacterium]|nr:glycosyltransferase family 4 protein [Phycisphaerae bacterium]
MQKKIALIIERSNVILGGAERSVFELSSALTARGHHVDIIAAKGQTQAKNIKILCSDLPGQRVPIRKFAKELKKYFSQNHYDIIHSVIPLDFADIYQPRGGTYAETILQNAISYQNPAISTYKKITSFMNFRRNLMLRAEKKICKKADGPIVAALSDYVANQFKKHYALDDSRIRVIENGVRINKPANIAEADKLRAQILSRLNLKEADQPLFFLFAANNFRLKGLCQLIKALSKALAQMQKLPFLIVAGRDKSQKYRWLARKLNVNKHILFLGSLKNIQNALSICDVAVLPTFYDPASRFILEALTAEKPVITTEFNGASDMFTNHKHGIVIDSPANIDALADALIHFSSTENREKASAAIREDNIIENISIRRVSAQIDNLYDSIIQSRSDQ